MRHHGGGPTRPETKSPVRDLVTPDDATGDPAGFRHYALAAGGERSAPSDRQAQAARAARLELRMAAPLNWDPPPVDLPGAGEPVIKPAPDPHDNPYITSGYTYLAQFIAHDMVATRVPFWATTTLTRETSNDRRNRLCLDALYGKGPTETPFIYVPADDNDLSRGKLQIGRSGPVQIGDGAMVCPFRDIARLKLSNTLKDLEGLTEPLIADPRNDDHALISQLTMVFCHLHNIFIDRQQAVDAVDPTFAFTRDTALLFAKAREATTLVYRRVIRDDLLKRLLHPAVYELYGAEQGPLLDQQAGDPRCGVPLEFSHAAFRFGHAMVRETYQINDVLPDTKVRLQDGLEIFSSARNGKMEPMPATWIIRWSNFFNMDKITKSETINLSRRIGPLTPVSLFGDEFGAIDPSNGRGIFYRDLISAQLADLWRVSQLLAAMQAETKLAKVIAGSALLQGTAWQDAIRTWLPAGNPQGSDKLWPDLTDEVRRTEIDAIACDPPLPFFVLFEAFKDPESLGCRLGRFGSILVADTLFGELRNKLPAERTPGSLKQQLGALHSAFADDVFDGPVTMASVIGFIDACLQKSTNPAMKNPSLL